MVRISLEIDGLIVLDRSLSRFGEQLKDFRQAWPGVIVELQSIMREQFRGQGVGQTGRWEPLSERYREWKERNFPGRPILQRTGATMKALTSRTQHSIIDPQPTILTFGVALRYPIYHQRGSGRLPRRPIFDLTEDHKVRIVRVVQRRVLQAGRENGVTLTS